jgi:hypothetical protein
MAIRRHAGVGCRIVANVAFALAMLVVGTIAACEDRGDGAGTRRPDGGSGSVGGAQGGGASGGGSGASISCNESSGGCLCLVGDAQPGAVATCSPASVVQNATEQGVCCLAQALCACTRFTCRSDPASSFCQCGALLSLAGVTLGTSVAECPAKTSEQKCCFSRDNATCICSRLACSAEEAEVPNCSAAAAGACESGQEIEACR